MTIGQLTLVSMYKEMYGKRMGNKWICTCECGETVHIWNDNIRRYKCHHKDEYKKIGNRLDLTGHRFGKLVAIEPAENRIGKSGRKVTRWKCLCDCGNEKIIDTAELTKGIIKSCGCYTHKFLRDKLSLVGQKFGRLTVLEQVESKVYTREGNTSSTMSRYKCKCDCGSIITVFGTVLRKGQVSCGCIVSKGEEEVARYLSGRGIEFERQKTFEDCLSPYGNMLMFDFYVRLPNDKWVLIEYRGQQHFIPQSNHFGDYQREVTDVIKRKYCQEKNLTLHEIRYDESISERLDSIIGNAVPSVA